VARIVFMGTPRFAVPILMGLMEQHEVVAVVTQPDRAAGRGRRITPSAVKSFATSHGLLVLQPTSLHQMRVIKQLRSFEADLFVVAAFGQMLPSDVLSIPSHGCLNVHASLLPKYRGASPIAWAILNGEAETGVTIMLMDEGMDTGPILAQRALAIRPDDTTGSLSERLAEIGKVLLLETIPLWLAGEISPRAQEDERATYARSLKKTDGLIDWNLSAVEIWRRCRAFDPWPGAYTFWRGRVLKLLRSRPLPHPNGEEMPGRVIRVAEGIAVKTGQGLLLLETVQLSGRRPLPIADFARGQRGFVGSILSNEGRE